MLRRTIREKGNVLTESKTKEKKIFILSGEKSQKKNERQRKSIRLITSERIKK